MHAKKSLGQNFLKNSSIIDDIITAAEIKKDEYILEVGPGKGALTQALLKAGAKVLAIEKDSRMVEYLQGFFSKEIAQGALTLIEGDILEHNIEEFTGKYIRNTASYKVVANIPYYITGELLRLFFETKKTPELMVLMVQKEVAERIVAKDGKESILSMSVKAFGKPTYIKTVEALHFDPIPGVDSAILKIDTISRNFFTPSVTESRFFEILKAGFAHKRKLLIRNLEAVAPKEKIHEAFSATTILVTKRAEEMSLEEWKTLISAL